MRLGLLGWGAGGAVVAILLAALGWGLAHPATSSAGVVGKPAPTLAIQSLDGGTVSLAELRGHPVVLNFWASWCPPCRQESPVLKQAADAHPGTVTFLGADIQDSDEAARAFLHEAGAGYAAGPLNSGSAAGWGVRSPPETFFIDAGGRVVARFTGPMDQQVLARYLGLLGVS